MFIAGFKVFQDSKILRLLLRTVRKAIHKLFGYFLFCSIFITIFAMVARMLLGSISEMFRNYTASASRLMTVFISRFQAVPLNHNHFTQDTITLIYLYNIIYIIVGFMVL